jgi:hypothetical protein
LGEELEVWPDRRLSAVEHKGLPPDLGRPARGRGREQDIDVAKKGERLGVKPAPEFKRLRDPRAEQPLQMKRRALSQADENRAPRGF